MNQYAQKDGDRPYQMAQSDGDVISVALQGSPQSSALRVNANNGNLARDYYSGLSHRESDLPEMFAEYTKQAHTTIMEGAPYEQNYDQHDTSLEGGKIIAH